MTKGGRATRPPLSQHRMNVGDSPSFAPTQQQCGRVALLCPNTATMWASRPHSFAATQQQCGRVALLCPNTAAMWASRPRSFAPTQDECGRVAHTPIALSRVTLNCRSSAAVRRQPRLAFDSDSVSKQMFKTNDPTHHADHHRPAQSRQDTQRNCQGRRMQPSRTSCRMAAARAHSPPTALTLTATLTSVDAS